MSNPRWQHAVNCLAGSWLFASPWVLDYLTEPFAAAANALIIGAAVLVCSLLALEVEDTPGTPKATLILGSGAMLAPWVFHFGDAANIATNSVAVGFVVFVMSVWMLAEEISVMRWNRNDPGPA